MRKALIIFILLFAFSLGLGVFAVYDAAQPRDEVLVSENLRYGEASAADGLSLTMHTNFDNNLFWDIFYTPGKPEKTENDPFSKIRRKITTYEYEKVAEEAYRLGFDGYMQDRSSATKNFTPDF